MPSIRGVKMVLIVRKKPILSQISIASLWYVFCRVYVVHVVVLLWDALCYRPISNCRNNEYKRCGKKVWSMNRKFHGCRVPAMRLPHAYSGMSFMTTIVLDENMNEFGRNTKNSARRWFWHENSVLPYAWGAYCIKDAHAVPQHTREDQPASDQLPTSNQPTSINSSMTY